MTDTPTQVKCTKCSKIIPDTEPRTYMKDGSILCNSCVEEMVKPYLSPEKCEKCGKPLKRQYVMLYFLADGKRICGDCYYAEHPLPKLKELLSWETGQYRFALTHSPIIISPPIFELHVYDTKSNAEYSTKIHESELNIVNILLELGLTAGYITKEQYDKLCQKLYTL